MQQHFDGEVQFKGTSVGCSITSSGQAFNHKVHFNGTGEWILQDSFTAPNLLSPFSYTTQLTEGTLNTNNQTLSTYNLGAEGAATTKLILANSAIIITGVYIGATGKFPFQTTGSGYSVDAGTSTIHFNGPQNSYYNGMRGGAQQRYYNVRFNYLASLYAMQDTFNNVHFENGGYLRGNGDIQTKFDRIESYGSYALSLQNGSLEIDTLRFGGDGIINGNNLYHHELSFSPSKSYTFRSGDIQQLDNAAEFNAIGTGGGGEITFNSSVAGQNAYIRKDSGRLCVDYIYVRDNWAIGNGLSAENPLCVSNPLCDTLLNSSLIPSFVNAGRARFQAGANANNQGNNAGWDFTPYPPPPALRLTTPNQTLCPGDSILLEFEIEGQLPASVRFFMDDGNGLIAVDSIDILPSSGSGTNIDPFLWQFYVPATSNTTFSTDNISILRCFNDNALGLGLATINFDCFLPLELHTFTVRPFKESV
jgi:hypothetical protein